MMKITARRYLLTALFFVLVLGGAKTSASVYEIAYNDGIGSFDLTLGSSGPNGSFQVTDIAGTSTLHGIFTLGGVGNDPGYDNLFYPNVASLVDDRGIEFLINDNQTRGLRNVVGSDQDVLSNGALLPVSALTIVSVDGNPIGTPTPPTATPTPVGPTPVPEKGRPVLALIACCAGLVLGFGSAGKPGWA